MSELNMERILNGTLHKRLTNKYNEMKQSGLTEESVNEYRALYANEPLSSVLQESELIFREPMEGLKFFESVVCDHKIPPYEYRNQRNKLSEFIEDNGGLMPVEQKQMYQDTLDKLDSTISSKENLITLGSSNISDDNKTVVGNLYDSVYMKDCDVRSEVDTALSKLDDNIPLQVSCSADILSSEDPNYMSKKLYDIKGMVSGSCEDDSIHKTLTESMTCWKYVLGDKAIQEAVSSAVNPNLKIIVEDVSNQNYRNILNGIFTKEETNFDPMFTSTEEVVMRMYSDDTFYEMYEDDSMITRVVDAQTALNVVESASSVVYAEYLYGNENDNTRCKSVLEMAGVESMTVKEAMDYLVEKTTDLSEIVETGMDTDDSESFFEFTQRGEATPTVRKSAGNLREGMFDNTSKRKSSASSLDDEDEDDDEDDEEDIKKSTKIVNKDASPKYSRERESGGRKPKLADKSATRKIQDKAMDFDAKMQKRSEGIKKGATEVKNAVKSVLRIPSNIANGVVSKCKEWNQMSDEKKKEKILEPGYRSEIFKTARSLLMYGAIWQFSKIQAILFFIIRHTLMHPLNKANKAKMKRLRNELTHELDTEIQVTEEKISDASNAGDQKQKYELMRIKRKLEAEKLRVQTNSKYI